MKTWIILYKLKILERFERFCVCSARIYWGVRHWASIPIIKIMYELINWRNFCILCQTILKYGDREMPCVEYEIDWITEVTLRRFLEWQTVHPTAACIILRDVIWVSSGLNVMLECWRLIRLRPHTHKNIRWFLLCWEGWEDPTSGFRSWLFRNYVWHMNHPKIQKFSYLMHPHKF